MEGEEPRLFRVHKWTLKLRFRELGRNKWGYAGIERSGIEKLQESEGVVKFRRVANFSTLAKNVLC